MNSPQRRLTLLVMLLCTGGLGASCPKSTITVPVADPMTRPVVVLDVYFPQGPVFTVTPAGHDPAMPIELNGGDEISLVASCTDDDSGCRNVQIYVEAITTAADGSMASAGLPTPLVQNLDANAAPGGTAIRQRAANVKLSVPQLRGTSDLLTLRISADATNAHDTVTSTKKFSLFWLRQAPLKVPGCDWLNPLGTPAEPPEVLDSRAVTVAVQKAKSADPSRTKFVIGFMDRPAPNQRHTWRLDVEDIAGLAPTMAVFRVANQTGSDKELRTVNGRNCTAATKLLKSGLYSGTLEVFVTSADTTSILLSEPNQDIGVWNEATFWPAFGGKRTTITWIQ